MNGKLHKYRRYGGKVYEHYTRGRYRLIEAILVDSVDPPVPLVGTEAMVLVSGGNEYVRTHRCVLTTDCGQCDAKAGKLCLGASGVGVGTPHYVRRDAWRWAKHG